MNDSSLPPAAQKAAYVNRMFAQIAHSYDLTNRLITAGQDIAWRRKVVELCQAAGRRTFLDVGTGTGDIAFEAARVHPDVEVIGCDFTYEMMAVGRRKSESASWRARWKGAGAVEFVQGDGMRLPFADAYFDAVASGFLLRNVTDVDVCLAEQRRVTKPGGRIVCLETSPPPQNALTPLLRFYLFRVIPLLAFWWQPAAWRPTGRQIGPLPVSACKHSRLSSTAGDGTAHGPGRFSPCLLSVQNVRNGCNLCGNRMNDFDAARAAGAAIPPLSGAPGRNAACR